jgi:hypothetical protein
MILRICTADSMHIFNIDSNGEEEQRVLVSGPVAVNRGLRSEKRTGRTVRITHWRSHISLGWSSWTLTAYLMQEEVQRGRLARKWLALLLNIKWQMFSQNAIRLGNAREDGFNFNKKIALLIVNSIDNCKYVR